MADHAVRGLLGSEFQLILLTFLEGVSKCVVEGHHVVDLLCSCLFLQRESSAWPGYVAFKECLRCVAGRNLLSMGIVCSIATHGLKRILHTAHVDHARIELPKTFRKILILVSRCLGGAHFQNSSSHSVLICSFVYLLTELCVLGVCLESCLPGRNIRIVSCLCSRILAQILRYYIR